MRRRDVLLRSARHIREDSVFVGKPPFGGVSQKRSTCLTEAKAAQRESALTCETGHTLAKTRVVKTGAHRNREGLVHL